MDGNAAGTRRAAEAVREDAQRGVVVGLAREDARRGDEDACELLRRQAELHKDARDLLLHTPVPRGERLGDLSRRQSEQCNAVRTSQ